MMTFVDMKNLTLKNKTNKLVTVNAIKKMGAIPCGSRFFAKRFPECVFISFYTRKLHCFSGVDELCLIVRSR